MVYLEGPNWEPGVKSVINELIELYGVGKTVNTEIRPYAVFDFDNSTSINDTQEQLLIWQIDHLAFEIIPDQMADVLKTGIPKEGLNRTYDNGYGTPVRLGDVIDDAAAAYGRLSQAGFVNAKDNDVFQRLKRSDDYLEFASKIRWLYDAITSSFKEKTAYSWIPNWYTGMTPDQVYTLAASSHEYYKVRYPTRGWYIGPADYESKAGRVCVSYRIGIAVAPEMHELYSVLDANGIDVHIVSASPYDVIRAAIDVFELPGVDGLCAFRNVLDPDGTYRNACDESLHALPQGEGKCDAIDKVIAPKYQGRGPVFCAIDSQGDFNFGTEYKDTKAVLILNRARKNDMAICTAVSIYQKNKGLKLIDINKNGDAFYLLQGRNENEGVFWPQSSVQEFGGSVPVLLTEQAQNILADFNDNVALGDVFARHTRLGGKYKGYKTR